MTSFNKNGLKYLQKMHELIETKKYCTVQSLMIEMKAQGFMTNNTVATILSKGGILLFKREGRKGSTRPLEWKGPIPNVKMVNELTTKLSRYVRGKAVIPFTKEQEESKDLSTSIPAGISVFEKQMPESKVDPIVSDRQSSLDIIIGKGLVRINHVDSEGNLTEFTLPSTIAVKIHRI